MNDIYNDNNFLVNKACISVGKMLDHAVYSLHQNADTFFDLFITSGLAAKIEQTDISIITGISGIELSYEVMNRCGIPFDRVTPRHTTGLSKEFYAAHALAHIQYDTGIPYEELLHLISVSDIIRLYDSYHSKAVSLLPWQMSDTDRAKAIGKIKDSFADELASAFESVGIYTFQMKKRRISKRYVSETVSVRADLLLQAAYRYVPFSSMSNVRKISTKPQQKVYLNLLLFLTVSRQRCLSAEITIICICNILSLLSHPLYLFRSGSLLCTMQNPS